MSEPTPEQRATFMAMFIGMAKDYGYTPALLLSDIARAWDCFSPTAELIERKRHGACGGEGLGKWYECPFSYCQKNRRCRYVARRATDSREGT